MKDSNLRYTLESGGSRIFNCLGITTMIEETAREAAASAQNGEHKPPRLFFENRPLNYTVFIKDMNPDYRRDDKDSTEKPIGTKIYLPFDTANAYAGGKSIFVNSRGFRNAIADLIGDGHEICPGAISRDLNLIEILDSMPALDPFLVKDTMQSKGIEIDPRYFQIAEEEWDRISDHIRQRIRPMVALALPDGVMHSEQRMAEMIDAIWRATDMRKLEPLIRAFLLPVEQTGAIFHAWKGIAFFEYQYMQISESAIHFARWLHEGAVPSHSVKGEELATLNALRDSTRNKVKRHWSQATGILKEYNYSYEKLFKLQGSAADFTRFMAAAPTHFWTLGDAVIRLQHAIETWERLTGMEPNRKLESDSLRHLLSVVEDLL